MSKWRVLLASTGPFMGQSPYETVDGSWEIEDNGQLVIRSGAYSDLEALFLPGSWTGVIKIQEGKE